MNEHDAREDPKQPDKQPQKPHAERVAADTVAGMREQFLDFYSDQYSKVVAFVRLARHTEILAAEDAAQNAFIEAWKIVQRGEWEGVHHPSAWIRKVALRQHDHPSGMRRVQPQIQLIGDEGLELLTPASPAFTGLSNLLLDLLEALRDFPDEQARAVMAFTLDGFTDTEIGRQLDIDPQRVRNQRTKTRAFLSRCLAHHRAQEGDTTR